uniref:SOCS box domain-containing protein n=1 Tax=Leptobrachium leishanense TaxID=445787 RepID=A0A8C5QPG1_9ANUR
MEAFGKYGYALTGGYQLYSAVLRDKPQDLRYLLAQDIYKSSINFRNMFDVSLTSLHLAARLNLLECLQVLLDNGAEVDCLDMNAMTPLLFAVWNGSLECVRALLKAGANPCGSRYVNIASVSVAIQRSHPEIFQELVEHGADINVRLLSKVVNTSASSGPLYRSVEHQDLESFRTLLLYGADPDYNCKDQELLKLEKPTSLLEFCLQQHCNIAYIILLIDFGANLYLPDLMKVYCWDAEIKELLMTARATPRSLKFYARFAIRQELVKVGRVSSIEQLEVPTKLKQYLKYELQKRWTMLDNAVNGAT